MSSVIYRGRTYDLGSSSVLEGLATHGVVIPSSCRMGVCQTCLMRAVAGNVPVVAKAGLKSTLAAQNYFLACVCYPEAEMEIALPEIATVRLPAYVSQIRYLNAGIVGVTLKPASAFEYKAGQFISLFKDEYTARCYSLASVPELDDELSLHVKRIPNGQVSNWIFESIRPGDQVMISEARGDCFYVSDKPDQNILLIGSSSGLAPLYGIVRDALLHGHSGRISLYHGSYSAEELYLVKEMTHLAARHANLNYVPCISAAMAPPGYAQGMVVDVALQENKDLSGWRTYICGNSDMVKAARRKTFFAGVSMRDIFADPFYS
jgi:CDP-4-dehydro-6-deoxyglucose reductase